MISSDRKLADSPLFRQCSRGDIALFTEIMSTIDTVNPSSLIVDENSVLVPQQSGASLNQSAYRLVVRQGGEYYASYKLCKLQ